MEDELTHTATGVYPKQKKMQDKKACIAMLRCISANLAASLFSFVCCKSSTTTSYDLARINYYAMAPRRVNNRNLRVIPFSQALLLFQIYLALCPTTPPPPPPTITPLRLTATDKGVSAYATLVGPSNSPQSNLSVSVVVVYVTLLPFCPWDPEH
jgi:hypothetical protein